MIKQPTELQKRTRERNWEIRLLRGTCINMCNLLRRHGLPLNAEHLAGLVEGIVVDIKAEQLRDSTANRKPKS